MWLLYYHYIFCHALSVSFPFLIRFRSIVGLLVGFTPIFCLSVLSVLSVCYVNFLRGKVDNLDKLDPLFLLQIVFNSVYLGCIHLRESEEAFASIFQRCTIQIDCFVINNQKAVMKGLCCV